MESKYKVINKWFVNKIVWGKAQLTENSVFRVITENHPTKTKAPVRGGFWLQTSLKERFACVCLVEREGKCFVTWSRCAEGDTFSEDEAIKYALKKADKIWEKGYPNPCETGVIEDVSKYSEFSKEDFTQRLYDFYKNSMIHRR